MKNIKNKWVVPGAYRGYEITYHPNPFGVTAVATHRHHETQSVEGVNADDAWWLIVNRIDDYYHHAQKTAPEGQSDPRVTVSISLVLVVLASCIAALALALHLGGM